MDLKRRFASVAIAGSLAFTGAFAAMPAFARGGEPTAEASEATPQVTDQAATQADAAIEVQLYALSSCPICGKSHSVIPVEGGDLSITDHRSFTAEELFGEDSGLQVDVTNMEQTGDCVEPYLTDGSFATLYGVKGGETTVTLHAAGSDEAVQVHVTVNDISGDDAMLDQVKHYQPFADVEFLSPTDGQIVDMKYLPPDFPVIQVNYQLTGEDGTDDLLDIGDVTYFSSDSSVAEPYPEGYGFKVNGTGTVILTVNIHDRLGSSSFANSFTVSIIDSAAESTGLTFMDVDGRIKGTVDITGSGEAIGGLVDVGASLKVDEVAEASGSLTDSVAAIEQQGNTIMGVYDISFVDSDGREIPIGSEDGFTMTVRLPFFDQANAGTLNDAQVYYVSGDGTYAPIDTWIENGCVCFTTTHLSTYVVSQSDKQAEKPEDDQKPEDEQKPGDEQAPAGEQNPGNEQTPAGEQEPGDEQKPAGEMRPATEQPEAVADGVEVEGETLPQTGDATLLMSGLAFAGSIVAFAGATVTRRR